VKIKVGDQFTVEGPKGKQTVPVPKGITFFGKRRRAHGDPRRRRQSRAAWIDARAHRQRRFQGVSTGFTRDWPIFGIGYRCEVKGPYRDVYAGLFASHRVLSAGRCGYEGRQAGE
jgi:ribosomal protein L6P/L9E